MQVRFRILGAALMLTLACAAFQPRSPASPGTPRVEFQNARFDGTDLSGRVLVGAVGGPITVDTRLTPHAIVHVEDVSDCLTGKPLDFLMVDSIVPERRAADLITLPEGHWYGAEVKFLVFNDETSEKPNPACIVATIAYWPVGSGSDYEKLKPAEVAVRVTRSGTSGPAGAAPDGGFDASVPEGAVEPPDPAFAPDGGGAVDGDGGVRTGRNG